MIGQLPDRLRDDPPELQVQLEDATTARDATRVESDPESTTRPRSTGDRQIARNPGEELEITDLSLPFTDPVDPGEADLSLPGEGDAGPGPKLSTLSAWAGVVIAGALVLNMAGVIDV